MTGGPSRTRPDAHDSARSAHDPARSRSRPALTLDSATHDPERTRPEGRTTMLRTHLTEQWALRYPILGAPMVGTANGKLARAITKAGGLGQIGISGETPIEYLEEESSIARGDDDAHFGIGLMIWALERRPELFDAAVAARPFVLSMSFGSPAPYVERAHAAGIQVATQVNSVAAAREAAAAGVDLIVAQGTEAGGHTGSVGTLPLLQGVLEAVDVPVVAAGGIATARGLAGGVGGRGARGADGGAPPG